MSAEALPVTAGEWQRSNKMSPDGPNESMADNDLPIPIHGGGGTFHYQPSTDDDDAGSDLPLSIQGSGFTSHYHSPQRTTNEDVYYVNATVVLSQIRSWSTVTSILHTNSPHPPPPLIDHRQIDYDACGPFLGLPQGTGISSRARLSLNSHDTISRGIPPTNNCSSSAHQNYDESPQSGDSKSESGSKEAP